MAYPKGKPRRDLSGERFGRLVVQRSTGVSKWGNIVWECLCDCGNTSFVPTNSLSAGNSTSCGCFTKERQHEMVALPSGQSAFNRAYRHYKYEARKRARVFELTKEEFENITSSDCLYCGRKPDQQYGEKADNGYYIYNGVDRVDPNKGYTIENSVPCCKFCNRAKDRMTQDEFAELIERMYQTFAKPYLEGKE